MPPFENFSLRHCVFICVNLCVIRNNKLLNLGVRDLKKVENHRTRVNRRPSSTKQARQTRQ